MSLTVDQIEAVRAQFPALHSRGGGGIAPVFFDNPAGTQVPETVCQAMTQCLLESNANLGGVFPTSRAADDLVSAAHMAMADYLNAPSPSEIVFGQNMTSLTFQISRALGRQFSEGDELIVSRMDHDANVTPWVLLARDHGLKIRWLEFDRETFEFDLSALDGLLSSRTRLLAVGAASNLTGTVHDVAELCRRAREIGALTYIDGVQYAPHHLVDVQAMGCDFFVCSAYKFFGPHQGILWGRSDVLQSLEPYKVRPAGDGLPEAFETGTQSHEGMAGVMAAVDYLAGLHDQGWRSEESNHSVSADGECVSRRQKLAVAMNAMVEYEQGLSWHLIEGLLGRNGIRVHGPQTKESLSRRVPTVSFTAEGLEPVRIAEGMARAGIYLWSGHNYAVEPVRFLGLEASGGVVRVGPVHYNTAGEIDRFLEVLDRLLDERKGAGA